MYVIGFRVVFDRVFESRARRFDVRKRVAHARADRGMPFPVYCLLFSRSVCSMYMRFLGRRRVDVTFERGL